MYHGYDVITQQGRDAVDEHLAQVHELEKLVHGHIQKHPDGIELKSVKDHFKEYDAALVHEAHWNLLSANQVRFTGDRKTQLAPEGHDNFWY